MTILYSLRFQIDTREITGKYAIKLRKSMLKQETNVEMEVKFLRNKPSQQTISMKTNA
jgi:hypothetical protein